MAFKVLLTERVSKVGMDMLAEKAEVVVAPSPADADLLPLIADADGMLIRSTDLGAAMLEAGKRLKVVGRHGIGVDSIDLKAATRLGIMVVNTPGANTNAVAEHALWAIMHCARNFNRVEAAFRAGKFCVAGSLPGLVQKMGFTTLELKGKTLGLVGMGRIARRLAEITGKCLQMQVRSYDPLVPDEAFASLGVQRARSLDETLIGADFVSLHVPHMPETHHLIGKRELALLKKSACLINSSRGGIVDEAALYEALKEKRIAGAALDVFEQEPPSRDLPFFGLDNVLVTPHMAAMTDLALINMSQDVATGILDALEGRRPQYLANPEVWDQLKKAGP